MQDSTVQIAASPLRIASAKVIRNGPSHSDRTVGPTWLSGALARARRDSTLLTHCSIDWRPPAACAAVNAVAAGTASTAAAKRAGSLRWTFSIGCFLMARLGDGEDSWEAAEKRYVGEPAVARKGRSSWLKLPCTLPLQASGTHGPDLFGPWPALAYLLRVGSPRKIGHRSKRTQKKFTASLKQQAASAVRLGWTSALSTRSEVGKPTREARTFA
jgi:hypothetical protein